MAIYIGYQKVTGSGGSGGGQAGVTKIVAGDNVIVSPEIGTGEVTLSAVTPMATSSSVGGIRAGFNGGAPDPYYNFPVALSGPDAYVGLQTIYNRIQQLETLVYGGNDMDLDNLLFDSKDAICLNAHMMSGGKQVAPGDYLCYVGNQITATPYLREPDPHLSVAVTCIDVGNQGQAGLASEGLYVSDLSTDTAASVYLANTVCLTKYGNVVPTGTYTYIQVESVRRIINSTSGILKVYNGRNMLGSGQDVFAVPLSACHWPSVGS